MLRRRPSNASEKDQVQKKKVSFRFLFCFVGRREVQANVHIFSFYIFKLCTAAVKRLSSHTCWHYNITYSCLCVHIFSTQDVCSS